MATKPDCVPLEKNGLRFVLCRSPRNNCVSEFIQAWKELGVTHVVRVATPVYDKTPVEAAGIRVVDDFPFEDQGCPDAKTATGFVDFVRSVQPGAVICVHCVAGMGRAPLMVGLALVRNGCSPDETVKYIREMRKGALNREQEQYLRKIKTSSGKNICIIL